MAGFGIKTPWTIQPRSNAGVAKTPIGNAVVHAWHCGLSPLSLAVDATHKFHVPYLVGTSGFTKDGRGLTTDSSVSPSGPGFLSTSFSANSTTNASILWYGYYNGTAFNGPNAAFSLSSATNAGLGIAYRTGTTKWVFRVNSNEIAATATDTTAGMRCFIGTVNGANQEFFINGVSQGTSSAATSIAAMTRVCISGDNGSGLFGSGAPVGGTTLLAVYFNRALTKDEVTSLSANPWQIFQPLTLNIWVPNAAASGAGVASGNGVATGSAVGASANKQAASGNGVATASAVGASANKQAASGNGVATGAAVGASSATSVASGNGVATGAAVGSSVVGGQGVASGNGVATGSIVGASTFAAVASGNGVATASVISESAGCAVYSGGYVDYGENARKRRELEEVLEEEQKQQTQDVEISEVKPVSRPKPTQKRQDRLEEQTARLEAENAALIAMRAERDEEIKRLLLKTQKRRQQEQEVLLLYAATMRQPIRIAA